MIPIALQRGLSNAFFDLISALFSISDQILESPPLAQEMLLAAVTGPLIESSQIAFVLCGGGNQSQSEARVLLDLGSMYSSLSLVISP
jgi:hypothetical protein